MVDVLMWNKYARVVTKLSRRLSVPPLEALGQFYNSRLFPLLTDESYPLITMSDKYIVNELVNEIRDNIKNQIK